MPDKICNIHALPPPHHQQTKNHSKKPTKEEKKKWKYEKVTGMRRDTLTYQRALGGGRVPELLPNQRQQFDAEIFQRDRKFWLRDEVRRDFGSPEDEMSGNSQLMAGGLINRERGDLSPDRHSMSSVTSISPDTS
jgi:hypothetical protein